MSWEAWFSVFVILFNVGLLIFTRVGADIVLVSGVTLLLLTGILTPSEALSGLANEGMVTVGVLYVVVAGLRETGAIGWLGTRLFGRPKSLPGAQLRMMAPITALSAVLNNTPLVAMMIPAVGDWAKRQNLAPSKLMIPLSYAAILGGTCSLIGTSTNLVVYGLMTERTELRFGLFDIAWVGVPCAVVGITLVVLFHRWLLPDRRSAIGQQGDPREYTVEMLVEEGGPLVGKTIEEAGLRSLPQLYLAEIDRGGRVIPAVGPQELLQGGDRLLFVGIVESVVDLHKVRGLIPAPDQLFKVTTPRPRRILVEAVVSNTAPLVGKSVREGRFRSLYNAVIIAVARNGERINRKIGDIVLQPGDTLLLEASPEFAQAHRNSRDFFLVSRIENSNPPRHERALLALGILLGMVATVTLGWLSMLQAALLAAGLMLVTRCITGSVARRSVDWQVLIVIAASFGLGRALEVTGAAETIASSLVALAGGDPYLSLVMIYLITMLFTELITNNGAAVLMFPIALATATGLGANFAPFAICIMMAASASFSTPIGYQTNLMVYGPGGYKFTDYFRAGIPMNLTMAAVTLLIAPRVWPL
ncbi:SLC13 family permease [Truepera radiovictrix]|uniref:TrkA-C domain protein n=1 Tax=Truepera radiovictrix (strain DSM 17093 / CIP 108686 / LMG 22925 / RQ-24) TaxID=649638 RepID=D7CXX1_TRURR|nr:SLC13 family permease [Truepera radiovictrix]ADI13331.1 TrkA-C domain protein [Truepera radiovictrix DSM 17093]WMT58104.1 SLC13 family permease [Truepera radiovictrix]